jgi:hypothetical protein
MHLETAPSPQLKLAATTLPASLFTSLKHVFAQGVSGCWLAGGTALAGFYAGHRRSDDLDLFTSADSHQRSVVLAIRSLKRIGAKLDILNETHQYHETLGELDGHRFKVTSVLDENLFRVGKAVPLAGNVQVVDLVTLLKMKSATLVSRCSEKDLYDLIWIFSQFPDLGFTDLIRLGNEIDAGVEAEAILASVAGSILREEACDFSLSPSKSAKKIFKEIEDFRESLLIELANHLEGQPAMSLGALVRALAKARG